MGYVFFIHCYNYSLIKLYKSEGKISSFCLLQKIPKKACSWLHEWPTLQELITNINESAE